MYMYLSRKVNCGIPPITFLKKKIEKGNIFIQTKRYKNLSTALNFHYKSIPPHALDKRSSLVDHSNFPDISPLKLVAITVHITAITVLLHCYIAVLSPQLH